MDVGGWLRSLDLGGGYEAAFRDNAIDEKVLPHLTAEDLREIGVATVGDRRKLLAGIAALATRPKEALASLSTRAAAPQISAERCPITVMLCDRVGSTSLAAKLDAEDWRNLVGAYLDEASAAVTSLGGHVLKKLDDGLMALFGYPQAQENNAERAVRDGARHPARPWRAQRQKRGKGSRSLVSRGISALEIPGAVVGGFGAVIRIALTGHLSRRPGEQGAGASAFRPVRNQVTARPLPRSLIAPLGSNS